MGQNAQRPEQGYVIISGSRDVAAERGNHNSRKSRCQFGSTGKQHRKPTRLPDGQHAPRLLNTV